MCGRYVLAQDLKTITAVFTPKVFLDLPWISNLNIAPGAMAPIVTQEEPEHLTLSMFGLTPQWAKKKTYWFNARGEGDHNKENDPRYTGAQGIIEKPAFRKAIRSQRCLVPASAFIEGTTALKLKDPYCVWVMHRHLFAFAGIYDLWKDPENGELLHSFSIITTVPNALLQELPHHRMPVILPKEDEQRWLDANLPLAEVLSLLRPYPDDVMNAYPISPKVTTHNGPGILNPVGEPLRPLMGDIEIGTKIELQGMGSTRARVKRNEEEQGSLF